MKPDFLEFELSGIVKDIPAFEQDNTTWSGGRNIHFLDQAAVRSGGFDEFAETNWPAGYEPLFQIPARTPTEAFWIYVATAGTGDNKIFVTDGTNHYDITPAAGVSDTEPTDDRWTGGSLNSLPFLNNGLDVPVWWNGDTGSIMQPLPDWPADWRCGALRPYKYHLFALDLYQGGIRYDNKLAWSSSAAPGEVPQNWIPAADNDAGDNILAATIGSIRDAGALRDSFIIYKQHSCYIAQYVGGNYVFSFRKLFTTMGIQARNCWAEIGGRHVVLTDDDVVTHDGQQYDSIAYEKMRTYLFKSLSSDYHGICCLAARHSTNEVWICIATVDSGGLLDVALVLNQKNGDWGVRSLPKVAYVQRGIIPNEDQLLTWDSDPNPWDEDLTFWDEANYSETADSLLMAGKEQERLYNVDALDSNAGQDLEAYVERTNLQIGRIDRGQVVLQIWPRIEGIPGDVVRVRCGSQSKSGAPIKWGVEQDYIIGTTGAVNVIQHGRLFAFKFSSTGGRVWRLHRFYIKATEQGLY